MQAAHKAAAAAEQDASVARAEVAEMKAQVTHCLQPLWCKVRRLHGRKTCQI